MRTKKGAVAGLVVLLLLTHAPLAAQSLNCRMQNSGFAPYSLQDIRAILPRYQKHVMSKGRVFWAGRTGLLTQQDDQRVKWHFHLRLTSDGGRAARLSFVFLPENGKLIARLFPESAPGPAQPASGFRFRYATVLSGTGPARLLEPIPILHLSGSCRMAS